MNAVTYGLIVKDDRLLIKTMSFEKRWNELFIFKFKKVLLKYPHEMPNNHSQRTYEKVRYLKKESECSIKFPLESLQKIKDLKIEEDEMHRALHIQNQQIKN